MPDEDKNFRGSLVLVFGIWWRHVKTIYYFLINLGRYPGILPYVGYIGMCGMCFFLLLSTVSTILVNGVHV